MSDRLNINFKPTLKQQEALRYLLDDKTTEIWYWGAAGWWKSYLWVFFIWMMAMQYPWTRWFMWRKELTNLTKTTVATYYKMLQDYSIPEYARGRMDWKNNIIRFQNWSEIYLLDLAYKPADPLYARLWSMEFTWGFVDESSEVAASALAILKTRIGRQRNDVYKLKPKILETFNPDKWHVYQDYYKPRKDKTMPEYKAFVPAVATDNPHLPQDYIEQLKKADEITRQRLLYGNFDYDDTESKLFRTDEIMDMFTTIVDRTGTTYISVDVARQWKDSTRIIVRDGLVAIRCETLQWATTDVTAQKVKDLEYQYNVHRHNIVVDTDWLWVWVADQIRGCYQFHNGSAPVKTDIDTNFWNLKTQCYYKLQELAEKRKIRLELSWADRDNLILELENILIKNMDKDGKRTLESKEDMKKRLGNKSPDIADAVMMRMVYVLEWVDEVKTYKAVFDDYNENDY